MSLGRRLDALRPRLAAAAQAIYDQWNTDPEDEDFVGDGICDEIADAMDSIINELPGVQTRPGGHEGDDHAWLIVWDERDAFAVDIPPGVYETGGGYSWRKIPDVTITEDDIVIARIDRRLAAEENPPRFPSKAPATRLPMSYPHRLAGEAEHAGAFLRRWVGGHRADGESARWRIFQATARFTFELVDSKDGYYKRDKRYFYTLTPRGPGRLEPAGALGDKRVKVFRRPKGAIAVEHYLDAIEREPDVVYRGMSWEEWQFIRSRGEIRSRGDYNLGDSQKHHTYFGEDPSTALHYANGFAPWPYKPGHERPGVVIAIDREHTVGDLPHVPDGERAVVGPLSARHVQRVWYLVATEITVMEVEIAGSIDERFNSDFWGQSRTSDTVQVAVVEATSW